MCRPDFFGDGGGQRDLESGCRERDGLVFHFSGPLPDVRSRGHQTRAGPLKYSLTLLDVSKVGKRSFGSVRIFWRSASPDQNLQYNKN